MGESTPPNFDSFRELLQRFGPLIESVAAQYAIDGDDQDDLYQEICIHVLKRIHQYKGRGALGGWIQRLAHRFARNWLRARKVRQSLLERYAAETLPIDLAESLTDNPSKLLDYKEFLGGLGRAFARLPERQADVMILIHLKRVQYCRGGGDPEVEGGNGAFPSSARHKESSEDAGTWRR